MNSERTRLGLGIAVVLVVASCLGPTWMGAAGAPASPAASDIGRYRLETASAGGSYGIRTFVIDTRTGNVWERKSVVQDQRSIKYFWDDWGSPAGR